MDHQYSDKWQVYIYMIFISGSLDYSYLINSVLSWSIDCSYNCFYLNDVLLLTPVKRAIMCAVLNTLYSIRHVISCVAFGNISMMYDFMHTHMYMLGKTSLLIIIRAGQSLEVSPKGQVLNQSQVCVNPWALGEVLVSGSWAYLLCWKLLTSEYQFVITLCWGSKDLNGVMC